MPTLTRVISSDDESQVVGMTTVDTRLFVLRYPSRQKIDVYDAQSLTLLQRQTVKINDLSDDTVDSGLASCVTNRCLYISDSGEAAIYKVNLGGPKGVSRWKVGRKPMGLSINAACNLLVAYWSSNKIQEYKHDGSLVREICLQANTVALHLFHAVQLANGRYVVSYMDEKKYVDDVIEIDAEGRIIASYTYRLQSATGREFDYPRHLAVDRKNMCILVADKCNKRLVLVNRSLNCVRVLNLSVEGGLGQLSCLYYDESRGRLLVGECDGQGRILVIDNVVDIANSF